MTQKKTPTSERKELILAINRLNKSVQELSKEHFQFHNPARNLWMFFLRGVLYGFGILVAAAVVIPLSIELLKSVELVPLIGDFLSAIAERMEMSTTQLR